ncbi:hypothetical protein OROHE_021596 [Orobanche hederae]
MKNNHEIVTVNLPREIITEILLRLPEKSLVRFTCVSKSWLFLISRSYKFAKAHVKILIEKNARIHHQKLIFGSRNLPLDIYTCSIQSIIDISNYLVVDQVYPTNNNDCSLFQRAVLDREFAETAGRISLVGSCNGLVCMNLPPNIIVVWNPTTRKSKELTNSNDVDMIFEYYDDFKYGFGYDELHDDYKVVELRNRRALGVRETTQVKIFSMRTNSWKILSSNWPDGDTFGETGTFLNGAVHWSVCDFNKPVEWVIVSQDLATDTFTELSVPKLDDYYVTLEVRILQGCLALYREHTVYMDVRVMKEYGVTESWNKVFRIPIPRDFMIFIDLSDLVRCICGRVERYY